MALVAMALVEVAALAVVALVECVVQVAVLVGVGEALAKA